MVSEEKFVCFCVRVSAIACTYFLLINLFIYRQNAETAKLAFHKNVGTVETISVSEFVEKVRPNCFMLQA